LNPHASVVLAATLVSHGEVHTFAKMSKITLTIPLSYNEQVMQTHAIGTAR
jgi:hypothetical protein